LFELPPDHRLGVQPFASIVGDRLNIAAGDDNVMIDGDGAASRAPFLSLHGVVFDILNPGPPAAPIHAGPCRGKPSAKGQRNRANLGYAGRTNDEMVARSGPARFVTHLTKPGPGS